MTELRCPQCNAVNRDTARYCAECGTPLLAGVSRSARPSPTSIETEGDGSTAKPVARESPPSGTDSASEKNGRILQGRYKIDKELGRGGFGAVYSAWDINLNRKCAVKENLEVTPEAQRQFSREATILANLYHPNLPRVIDHFSIAGQGQYLVMDFVEGEDLLSMVSRQGKVQIEKALKWVIQVADALVYLHGQKPPVLHRDIKPANIRITPDGDAMLVDFGLVKVFDPKMKTTMGARAVTPGYAPPEQYGHGMTDARTDIYALGATLYNLLTGIYPLESVMRMVGKELLPVRESNPEVSHNQAEAVERAMAMEPAARYQTAAEFLAALKACLPAAEAPILVARIAPQPVAPTMQMPSVELSRPEYGPVASRKAPPKRKVPWLWITLGGLVLVGLLGVSMMGGLYVLMGSSSTRTPTNTRGSLLNLPTRTPATEEARHTPEEPTPLPIFRSPDPHIYKHLAAGEPDTLDPALDYETSGQEIISNIYDSLVFYNKNFPSEFVPQLALEVPSLENGGISQDGRVYRFKIRPEVTFHDGRPFSAEDVAYTFQRSILQGGSDSPQWLFTEPLLGAGSYDITDLVDPALLDDPAALQNADPGRLVQACQRVKEAVRVEGGEVVFTLAQPWSPFLATMATGYASIVSREWVIDHGGWDGDCATWHRYYGRALNQINENELGTGAMGTGPYLLDHWELGKEIVLRANEKYWRREPAWEGGPAGPPAIKEVHFQLISDFDTRFAQLQAREVDSISTDSVPDRSRLDSLVGVVCSLSDRDCQPSEKPEGALEMVRGGPSTTRTDLFFTFEINTAGGNGYIGSGQLDGDGIPPNFFSNEHVRRAFSQCFNYDRYLREVMHGEGIRTINVMLPNMPGYDPDSPYYNYDPERCADEFRQAQFNGRSVWDAGFRMVVPYPSSYPEYKPISEILKDELAALNNKFRIEVLEVEGSEYFGQRRDHKLPLFTGGWLEDVHDPHNWLIPYTVGTFSIYQAVSPDLRNQLESFVTRGVAAADPNERKEIYRGFNRLYYEQAPAILLYVSVNRHYQQRWVNGWFDNPVYPGIYYYVLSKD